MRADPKNQMNVKNRNSTNETHIVRCRRQISSTVGNKLWRYRRTPCRYLPTSRLYCLNDFGFSLRKFLKFGSSLVCEKCRRYITSTFWNLNPHLTNSSISAGKSNSPLICLQIVIRSDLFLRILHYIWTPTISFFFFRATYFGGKHMSPKCLSNATECKCQAFVSNFFTFQHKSTSGVES